MTYCDVQVVMYGVWWQIHEPTGCLFKHNRHKRSPPLTKNVSIHKVPPHHIWILLFPSLPVLVSSSSPVLATIFVFLPHSHHCSVMTQRPGPWQLDKVKAKLRREQVERESAASARYRQEEDKNKVAEKWKDKFLVFPLLFVGCVLSFLILVCSSFG